MRSARLESDADLLDRLLAGDEAAFTGLVRRYHERLVRLAMTFVHRGELAEDAVQETWLAVLGGIERFERRSSLQTWLFQICVNKARSLAVREERTVPVDDLGLDRPDPADAFADDGSWATPPRQWSGSLEDDVDDAKLLEAVRVAIADLPPIQQQVVTLRDVEGIPAREVCTLLSITDANQRVMLHRGRARVRAALQRVVTP